jgi:hypothetical protein
MWQKVAKFKGAEYFRKALYTANAEQGTVFVTVKSGVDKRRPASQNRPSSVCFGTPHFFAKVVFGQKHCKITRNSAKKSLI